MLDLLVWLSLGLLVGLRAFSICRQPATGESRLLYERRQFYDVAFPLEKAVLKPSSHVFIVNGAALFGAQLDFDYSAKTKLVMQQRTLNDNLTQFYRDWFQRRGHFVEILRVMDGFDPETAVLKYLRADLVIYQYPLWWFGPPSPLKEFIDVVFMAGLGRMWKDDGRSQDGSHGLYGTGGLMYETNYMLSMTGNLPKQSIENPGQLLSDLGVAGLTASMTLTNDFVGMSQLKPFIFYDIVKNPAIESQMAHLEGHLEKLFAESL